MTKRLDLAKYLLVQTQLSRRSEQVHLGRVDLDLDGRANLRQRTRIHTNRGELVLVGHDLGSLSCGAIGDDVAVDVAIGAQILDVHNLQGEGVRVVSRGQTSVLRTEADHDLAL